MQNSHSSFYLVKNALRSREIFSSLIRKENILKELKTITVQKDVLFWKMRADYFSLTKNNMRESKLIF